MFTYTVQPVSAEEGGPGGEPITVTADSRDVLQWEKRGSGRSISKFLAEPTLKDSYVLAYLAATRRKLIDCSPQAFEENYLLVMGQDPTPDPTRPGA